MNLALINFTITIEIFFWLYWALVAIFCVVSLFNIYHLLRFGQPNFINLLVILAYLAVSFGLIYLSLITLTGYDWSTVIISSNQFSSDWSGFGRLMPIN